MGFTTGCYEIDVHNRITINQLFSFGFSFRLQVNRQTAHVVPKLFKAIILFSDRATIYSDVTSLPADQLKTHPKRVGGRKCGPHFPSNQPRKLVDNLISPLKGPMTCHQVRARFSKWLVTANHTHTWWHVMGPLNCLSVCPCPSVYYGYISP